MIGAENGSVHERYPLKGSERKPMVQILENPEGFESCNPNEIIELTLRIRRKLELGEDIVQHGALSQDQIQDKHGMSPKDLDLVNDFLNKYHLQKIEDHHGASTLKISGKISDLERAFETHLDRVKVGNQFYRQRIGSLTVPEILQNIILGVFGLDNRPQARPRLQVFKPNADSYSALDIANLYNFPEGDGLGQTIALIELGGGYKQADLDFYFASLGLKSPNLNAISVSGGNNNPIGDYDSADGEVMMDIEIAGALAPKANFKVYFGMDNDKGFLDTVNAAIHDSPSPTVISISWGGPESHWTEQTKDAMESAFMTAAAMSIPITVASGDNGSTDGGESLSIDFPACAPHALACGGTHLEGHKIISREIVWNDNTNASGGGISDYFSIPDYQKGINTLPPQTGNSGGRGVPDIAGNAAPETGYKVRVDGEDWVMGGTSAVAPLWAGLIARMASNLGTRIPFLNPILYAHPEVLNDITEGNNDISGIGSYLAGRGWDPCTGLGSPRGLNIQKLIQINLNNHLLANIQNSPDKTSDN